ncbi:MAG: AraC family transcriptional regulator [Victivallaceae bacterium]|nr:AraC family transcriptional regulator [Victivallaceae bacterium]
MNITGNIFDDASLRIMLDSNCWKIACSRLPVETPQLFTEQHDKWLKKNVDKHQHREILLALKGNSLNSLNGTSYLCSPGSLFLFDEFEEHDRVYSSKNEDIDHLWIHLVEGKIAVRIASIRNHRIEYSGHDLIIENKNLVLLMVEVWDSLKSSKLPNALKRKKLVAILSLFMLELVERDLNYDGKAGSAKTYQAQTIDMIKEHIISTSGKSLTIDKLARIAGYSKFHFLRLFKQHTGESIHKYINAVRISKVKNMLKNGYSKKEIAEELGFSCASSFSHWFRKNLVK